MKIVADSGRYFYRSPGGASASATCGVYVVAPADTVVLIEMETVEVECGEGLVVVRERSTVTLLADIRRMRIDWLLTWKCILGRAGGNSAGNPEASGEFHLNNVPTYRYSQH